MSHLIESIASRYSPVSFTEKPVSQEDLNTLLDAARRAPSSYNEQPWRFIYAFKSDSEAFNRMLDTLVDVNREWAQTAPVLMLSVARKRSDVTGGDNPYHFHDTGMAVASMLVQGVSMGIQFHQMGGYDRDKARELLDIPDGFEPVAMMALGYPGDLEKRSPQLQERAKQKSDRHDLSSIVSQGSWKMSRK